MLSEMLGEMNVSHTGAYYSPQFPPGDQTASLGLLYDYSHAGNGVKIADVIQGGPVDLAASGGKAGHIIEAIDGTTIDASMDFYKLLNRKAGKYTLLSVYDPAANKRWDESVKPVSRGEELSCSTNVGCDSGVRRPKNCPADGLVTSMSAR